MNIALIEQNILIASLIVLAISLLAIFLRAIIGPRVADRIICINMIGTKVIIMICIISAILHEDFIVDVALVYALINFVAIVVLTYAYQYTYLKSHKEKIKTTVQIKNAAVNKRG